MNAVAQTFGSIPVIVYTLRVVAGAQWRLLTLLRGALAAAAAGALAWLAVRALVAVPGVVVGTPAVAVAWLGLLVLRGLVAEDAGWARASLHLPLRRRVAEGAAS